MLMFQIGRCVQNGRVQAYSLVLSTNNSYFYWVFNASIYFCLKFVNEASHGAVWTRFLLEDLIFLYFIFIGNETNQGVEFRHSTRHASRFRQNANYDIVRKNLIHRSIIRMKLKYNNANCKNIFKINHIHTYFCKRT